MLYDHSERNTYQMCKYGAGFYGCCWKQLEMPFDLGILNIAKASLMISLANTGIGTIDN